MLQTKLSTSHAKPASDRVQLRSAPDDVSAQSAPVIIYGRLTAALNNEIGRAFATGAPAVLLLADRLLPCAAAVDQLRRLGSALGDAVVSGTVADARHPSLLIDQGHWWSQEDTCWQEHRWIERVATADTAEAVRVASVGLSTLFVPASVWRRVGPFDLRFDGHLADLDWVLRAHAAGVALWRASGARFLDGAPDAANRDRAERLRASLALARKHGVPAGPWRLALQRVALDAERECSLVQYRTADSDRVGAPKRIAWYALNLLRALRRERFRQSVALTWRALRTTRIFGGTST